MRLLLLLGLLAVATRCLAQRPDSTRTFKMSLPIQPSPMALLSTLPPLLSPDDSLQQRAYRRNRVKTVTLVRLRGSTPADTVDYTELDREGHIVHYRPAFGQSYRQRYSRQHQLIAHTIYPVDTESPFSQATYDPATKITTTLLGPSLAQLSPWQVARTAQYGDTLLVESFFHPNAQLAASPVRRLVLRVFHPAPDTTRTDLLAYDVSEQLLQFESYYQLGNRYRLRETGTIAFGAPTAAEERQTPSDAQRCLVASRRTHGRYIPNTRLTYNTQGSLVRRFFMPLSRATTPKTTYSADGRTSMTISTPADSSSVRYVRAPNGQLLREEYRFPNAHSIGNEPPVPTLSFTEYTYLSNGLRKTKAGSMPARYEYRYTYY